MGFFDGVTQQEVRIAGQRAKIPIFYRDGTAITALLPASIRRLRRILPDARYRPASLLPGVGVVGLTALDYRDTDIGPYGEFSFFVALRPPFSAEGPGLLGQNRRKQMHIYIWHLPVTTEIALRGGVDYYNFPKFIANIDFENAGGEVRCRLSEKGEPIATLSGKRIPPTRRDLRMQNFIHLYMDGQPQSTEFKIHASEWASSWGSRNVRVELGQNHPVARALRGVLLSTRPLQYLYMPRFEAILYGPERFSLSLLMRALQAIPPEERRRAGEILAR